jgi:hypothetical protein
MTRRRAVTALATLSCLCLIGAGVLLLRGRDKAGPVSFPPGSLAPSGGALLGAWVTPPGDFTRPGRQRAVAQLESELGRRLDINHHFYNWDKPFPSEDERWDLANGRIPMISWGDRDTQRVASGADDDLVRERADALKALGRPVLLRWFWEMDGDRYRAVARSAQDYVAAWRTCTVCSPSAARTTSAGCGARTRPASPTAPPNASIPATTTWTGSAPTAMTTRGTPGRSPTSSRTSTPGEPAPASR